MKNLMKIIAVFVGLIAFTPEVKAPSEMWKAQYVASLGDQNTWSIETLEDIRNSCIDFNNYRNIPDQDERHRILLGNAFGGNELQLIAFGGSSEDNLTDTLQFLYGIACHIGNHIGFDVAAFLNNQI